MEPKLVRNGPNSTNTIMIKRILFILLAITVVAQFFQPDRSVPVVDPANDMLVMTQAPTDIRTLVEGACYDCHSDKTNYPWYAYITPMNFIVQDHINEGRAVLNFSDRDKYAGSEAAGECGESIVEGEMPPAYYRLMHTHGRLSQQDQQKIVDWFNANLPGAEGGEGDAAGKGGDADSGEEE